MVPANYRDAKLIINKKAIFKNIYQVKQRLGNEKKLFIVVKANAYGHGAIQVAKIAEKAGANGFCVALLDEALQLRQANFIEPILVLGVIDPIYAKLAAVNDISLTAPSFSWIEKAGQYLKNSKLPKLNIHLALDTGMGRIGFQTNAELIDALEKIKALSSVLNFEGVYTHFATADEKNVSYFNCQYRKFKQFMKNLSFIPRYVHVANSATFLWHHIKEANMVRLGIASYGLNPSGTGIGSPYPLYPALSLRSDLIFVKKVKKGQSIGYGATYKANNDQWIGTVPIGYADGISRKLQGFSVLVDGKYCPIVGRVCMDQFMIKLPQKFSYGTPVTIIGKSKNKVITVNDIASYIGTINYEVLCNFSDRLKRIYI